MTKYAGYGTSLAIGVRQTEIATIVGAITGSGDITVKTTAAGMTGSTITTTVAVLNGDTTDTVAEKIRVALRLVANIVAKFAVGGSGSEVVLTKLLAAADDNTLNISVEKADATGLTDDTTSDAGIAGVVSAAVAQIRSITPASLSLDVEDVTTLDSTEAWEEVVGTVLRTGNLSMEIVYDPNLAGHGNTSGLLYYQDNKVLVFVTITFPDSTAWSFPAYVVSFEPSAPHDGALTASVGMKITGKPTLV